MIQKSCIIIINIFLVLISFGQDVTYKEKVDENYTRFYYDDNYYLVDKNCEFKSIERVAQYDTINLKFNGEFKDFNSNGRLILQGTYRNGLKHGKFTAYHTNGQIKWESNFIDDNETGLWKYYYPDGKPMLTLLLDTANFKIIDFWDVYGQQKIISGQGEYNIEIPIKGFTDHGYTLYNTKGLIKDGLPEGNWSTSFVINGKKKQYANLFTETFSNGERTSIRFNEDFIDTYIPQEDLPFVPSDFFSRGELFLLNNCTFDDYSGFRNFISRKINHKLSVYKHNTENTNFQMKIKYSVSKAGIPTKIDLIQSSDAIDKESTNNIYNIFKTITYLIPSISDGKPIKDNIIFTANLVIHNQRCVLQYLKIEREKGQ